MKYITVLLSFLAINLSASAFNVPPDHQKPLSTENVHMPEPTHPPQGPVILSDVLGRDRSINIFAGFTRDIAAITERFSDSKQNTTILAPVNSAIMALPRKPWEDQEEYHELGADAYEGDEGQERARRNMKRFVEAHVVVKSPWQEEEKAKTLGGEEVWWERKEGSIWIQPGNVEVSSTEAGKVQNGEIWILKGVRNYT